MEDEYLETIAKGYTKGDMGKRGIDTLAKALGFFVGAMEDTGQDVLGDVFQGAIAYGEHGQFLTPDSVTDPMAKMCLACGRTCQRSACCPNELGVTIAGRFGSTPRGMP